MSEVINLRQARKVKQRIDANARADANRMKFGQTKAERHKQRVDAERAERLLDGARRDTD